MLYALYSIELKYFLSFLDEKIKVKVGNIPNLCWFHAYYTRFLK